jgi:ankyrin repeat protein
MTRLYLHLDLSIEQWYMNNPPRVEQGADINANGGKYGNALQAAASNGNQNTVRYLIEHGADVNAMVAFTGMYSRLLRLKATKTQFVIWSHSCLPVILFLLFYVGITGLLSASVFGLVIVRD